MRLNTGGRGSGTSPRWSGTLSAERKKNLIPFDDNRSFQRNVRTTDDYRFTLDGWMFGGWHLLLGAVQYEQENEQTFLAEDSFRARGGEAGIKYVAASGSSISVIRRSTQGDYLNSVVNPASFTDNAFNQDESEVQANWNLSGKSALNGRLGWVNRHHEHFAERDFSGLAGELAYAWKPTGKLRLDVLAKRNITSWQEPFASYRVDNSLSLKSTWQVSAKTAVRMQLERVESDFRGPVFAPPARCGATPCTARSWPSTGRRYAAYR